jgi:Peptidase family M48
MKWYAAAFSGVLSLQVIFTLPCDALEMPKFLRNLTTARDSGTAPPPPSDDAGGSSAPGGGAPARRSLPWQREKQTDSAAGNAGAAAATGGTGDNVRIQEVHRGPAKASVVLDKRCKRVVQSYSLTDNLASVGVFAADETMKSLPEQSSAHSRSKKDPNVSGSAKHAAKQMNWLPMSAEVLYGERAHVQETSVLDRDSKLGRKFYLVADKLLSDVLSGIGESHDYKFRIYILKNSTRNAMARPGGFIYVDQGLIENAAYHPKAYFAVAHEIAHVLQRHETKELQSMIIDSVQTKNDIAKVVTRVRGDPAAVLEYVKVQKNVFTQHHIDQELQADACAARILGHVLPDTRQLAGSLQAFLKDLPKVAPVAANAHASANGVEKLADTAQSIVKDPVRRHPTSQQRYENLRSMYAEVAGPKGR